jgi:hypothetical protein
MDLVPIGTIPTSENQAHPRNPKAFLIDGRWDTLPGNSTLWSHLEVTLWRIFRRTKLCEYVLEFCSFFRRISLLRHAPHGEAGHWHLMVELAPDWKEHPEGHLVPCTPTHARSLDIERFSTNHSWSTRIDYAVFLLGWDAGARWAADNICNEDTETKGESN